MRERRVRRSEDRTEALSLVLDACRERCGARAVVLADERGLLLASAGVEPDEAEALAARIPAPELRRTVDVATLFADETQLFVGVDGARADLAPILDAVAGARRLLALRSAIAA